MADFVQTMKDWRRMCKAQDELRGDRACCGCPLESYGCPSIYDDVDNADYADVENKVSAWAAEHPVVYPTWAEYISKRIIHEMCEGEISGPETVLTYAMNKPIPADIAEKLGIEPKEE